METGGDMLNTMVQCEISSPFSILVLEGVHGFGDTFAFF